MQVNQAEPFGAIVSGIDMALDLTSEQVNMFQRLVWKHKVVSFVNQHVSTERLTEIAQLFGEIHCLPSYNPCLKVERNPLKQNVLFGGAWHADLSFLQKRPAYTMLYSVEVPTTGGDTLFADQQACFEQFSKEDKAILTESTVEHSVTKYSFEEAIHSYGTKSFGAFSFEARKYTPDEAANLYKSFRVFSNMESDIQITKQKAVIIHPRTNEQVLNVNEAYTSKLLKSDGTSYDQEYLCKLFQMQTKEEFLYRLKWSPNMITIWDNRSVLHKATATASNDYRLMFRIMITDPLDNDVSKLYKF